MSVHYPGRTQQSSTASKLLGSDAYRFCLRGRSQLSAVGSMRWSQHKPARYASILSQGLVHPYVIRFLSDYIVSNAILSSRILGSIIPLLLLVRLPDMSVHASDNTEYTISVSVQQCDDIVKRVHVKLFRNPSPSHRLLSGVGGRGSSDLCIITELLRYGFVVLW